MPICPTQGRSVINLHGARVFETSARQSERPGLNAPRAQRSKDSESTTIKPSGEAPKEANGHLISRRIVQVELNISISVALNFDGRSRKVTKLVKPRRCQSFES